MRWMVIVTCLVVGSLAHAAPKPEAELRSLVDYQILWAGSGGEPESLKAWLAPGGGMFWLGMFGSDKDGPLDPEQIARMIYGDGIKKKKISSFVAHVTPDGKSAVISFTARIGWEVSAYDPLLTEWHDYRVSEVAQKTAKGWRITGGFWSGPKSNAEANKDAKAGKLTISKLDPGGDKSLLDAFSKLTSGPFDDAAAKRKDLVAFGSGPNERTVGGSGLAKAWQTTWANKLTVDSAFAATAGDTLGFVLANTTLQKKDYKIPFRIMVVFERKTSSDAWSVVHVHFAVP